MPDNRPFSQWDASSLPVIAFAPASHAVLYHNPAAAHLEPGGLIAGLPSEERAALLSALDGQSGDPVFLHAGGEVYSPLILPAGGCTLCLFQAVTGYYNRTRDALDQALMASEAKTTFLSEMSHDIRTPMGAIAGLTDIALSQPGSPTKVTECLKKIKVASEHMMSLLNEVLDMSRIESGRVQIQPEPTNLSDLLHEILIVARPQADSGGLRFVLEMGRIARENLVLDSVRLKQVCLNLLSNAIKYTPRGGRVDMAFAVLPAGDGDSVTMHVQVKDNGIGMSREFLMKLFTPFEREEKSSVHKIQGTGLGMTITKNLIELMGGQIQVESETDKGSCFTLDLPFTAAPDPDIDGSLEGCKVLLLDSDARQGDLTLSLLKELGMECDWARSAMDAAAYLNDCDLFGTRYQFLLAAEKLEGAEMALLLPELRNRLGQDLPILLLTDSDWSQIEYVFTRSGVDGHIPLPLFKSKLASLLSSYAGGAGRGAPPAEVRCNLSGLRLLLAEDNELNREIAVELIGESGALIDCAEDGRQAVDMFQNSSPGYYDAILMDVQMPVLGGLDATRELRALARPDAKSVPIIAMTANAFVEDVKKSLEAGMDAHISKPLDIDKVLSTIDSLARGRRP